MHHKKSGNGKNGGMKKKNGMNGGMKNGKMQKKTNGLTPAQKKLPPALQKAIEKKDGKKEEVEESINEGKFKKEERTVKNLASVLKIDFSEAIESLEEDGVLEAMDHLENAIERIKDVHKILKRKS